MCQADETPGVFVDDSCDMVVQKFAEIGGIRRLRPVAEHNRHSRQDLDGDVTPIAVRETHGRVPAIRLDLAKEFSVKHHSRAAGTMMLKLSETTIAVSVFEIRPVLRKDVCVNVDLQLAGFSLAGITVPH